MSEPQIVCPKCRTAIRLTDSLAAPLLAKTRKQFEQRLAQQEIGFAKRETELRKRRDAQFFCELQRQRDCSVWYIKSHNQAALVAMVDKPLDPAASSKQRRADNNRSKRAWSIVPVSHHAFALDFLCDCMW